MSIPVLRKRYLKTTRACRTHLFARANSVPLPCSQKQPGRLQQSWGQAAAGAPAGGWAVRSPLARAGSNAIASCVNPAPHALHGGACWPRGTTAIELCNTTSLFHKLITTSREIFTRESFQSLHYLELPMTSKGSLGEEVLRISLSGKELVDFLVIDFSILKTARSLVLKKYIPKPKLAKYILSEGKSSFTVVRDLLTRLISQSWKTQ